MTYQPTRWNDGDTITAEKMNHLEQGVAQQQAGPAGPQGPVVVQAYWCARCKG